MKILQKISVITAQSPQSLFIPICRNFKQENDFSTLVYAKNFYREMKREQNQASQSNLNILNPNTKSLL